MKNNEIRQHKKYPIIFLMVITSISGAMFLDTILPAIPYISSFFNASNQRGQEIIFYYLFGMAISQLFLGSLMDSFGRKIVLLICLLVMFLCSLGAVMSNSIIVLLFLSAIIGLGAGGCSVTVRAVMRDCFNKEALAHGMSIINLFLTISPAVFPVLGSYLQHYFQWHAICYFTAIYLLVTLVGIFWFLKETHQKQYAISIKKLFGNYGSVVVAPGFLKYCYTSAAALSGVYIYFAISTVLLQRELGISITEYGWLALIFALTSGISRLVTVRTSKIMSVKKQLHFGIFVMAMAGPIMYLMVYGLDIRLWGVFIPMLVFVFGSGFVFATSIALAFEHLPHIAGTASSVYGFLRMIITCLLTLLAIHLDKDAICTLATMLTLLSFSALALIYTNQNQR